MDINGIMLVGGAGTGPEHLTSADTFQSGGAQFKGWDPLTASTLVAGQNRVVDLMLVSAVVLSRLVVRGSTKPLMLLVALTVTLTSLTYLPVLVVVVETSQGGGGGGAIKIVSTGTLTIGANIWADGGRGGARWNEARRSGGSGSGGAIYSER